MSKSPQIEYRGNCHCGAFKFILKVPELKQALACNCSICFKNGYMWAFPASTGDLIVVKGDENESLKSYEFGQRSTMYKFCATCGTSVLGRMPNAPIGRSSIGVNIRALADVNLDALAIITNNGSATKPEYQPPEPVAVGYVPEGTTVYTGNYGNVE
ncbi:glutathione-dependent formaldehyde-activating, GFA [Mycena crocata]|nr:glutathione-dependent formaldehyde-activating, GFA [Mycena crocata]